MKPTIVSSLLSVVVCLLAAGSLPADEKDTLNPYDVEFLKSAGQSSLNEVKIAELGVQKALNPDVKLLATTLVKDHNAVLAQAKALAEKKGVAVSASIDDDTAQAFKELERKSGTEFDRDFVKHMDSCHVKAIKSFEDAQKEVKDVDLKTWADKTIVTIKAHHESIKKLK